MGHVKSLITRAASALMVAGTVVFATALPASAHAQATSVSPLPPPTTQSMHAATAPIGSFSYSFGGITIKVPTGCFLTIGANYNPSTAGVADVNNGTACIGPVAIRKNFCNSRIYFNFWDTNNRKYYSWTSPLDTKCHYEVYADLPVSVVGRYGQICSGLLINGINRGHVCVTVHR